MRPIFDLLVCLRLFTRVPVPVTRRETELGVQGFSAAAAMVPLAGAIVGLVPASVLLVASAGGVPALTAAVLAMAMLVLATGALHEDALADCADGFGGGRTRDRKLEIMRDSRIGAFGTCAIVLSLLLRVSAVDGLVTAGPGLAVAAVIVAASVSRTICLLPLRVLPRARSDGMGAAAGRPSRLALAIAAVLATGIGLALLVPGVSLARLAVAIGLSTAGAGLLCAIASRQIGGQTGDVVGATQQLAECLMLLALAAAP